MSLESIVDFYKTTDLTGQDIYNLINRFPILYSNLSKYRNLKELLTDAEPYVVILYQTSTKTNGHFVALFADDKNIFFFDSYGIYPDGEKQFTKFDRPLPNYLSDLIKNDGRPLIWNKIDYQSKHNNRISTCGRWSCTRIMLRHLSNEQFERIFLGNKSKYLSNHDNVITLLTLTSLDDFDEYYSR